MQGSLAVLARSKANLITASTSTRKMTQINAKFILLEETLRALFRRITIRGWTTDHSTATVVRGRTLMTVRPPPMKARSTILVIKNPSLRSVLFGFGECYSWPYAVCSHHELQQWVDGQLKLYVNFGLALYYFTLASSSKLQQRKTKV